MEDGAFMSILTGSNLSIGYDGKELIGNINFSIKQGDYLCIVGENGAGKSTLMKTLLGLISPMKGEILFTNGLKKNEIGYLPQQTVVQRDFPASVEEIVLSGCQGAMGIRPFYTAGEKSLAKENMERMGILDLKKRCYRDLSGGQQQRVLLARALCATRKALLLDEPVAGLDIKTTIQLYSLIKQLNDEGITIIMISHDVAAAVKYASHVMHVDTNTFFGTKEEYLKSEQGKRFLLLQQMEEEEQWKS